MACHRTREEVHFLDRTEAVHPKVECESVVDAGLGTQKRAADFEGSKPRHWDPLVGHCPARQPERHTCRCQFADHFIIRAAAARGHLHERHCEVRDGGEQHMVGALDAQHIEQPALGILGLEILLPKRRKLIERRFLHRRRSLARSTTRGPLDARRCHGRQPHVDHRAVQRARGARRHAAQRGHGRELGLSRAAAVAHEHLADRGLFHAVTHVGADTAGAGAPNGGGVREGGQLCREHPLPRVAVGDGHRALERRLRGGGAGGRRGAGCRGGAALDALLHEVADGKRVAGHEGFFEESVGAEAEAAAGELARARLGDETERHGLGQRADVAYGGLGGGGLGGVRVDLEHDRVVLVEVALGEDPVGDGGHLEVCLLEQVHGGVHVLALVAQHKGVIDLFRARACPRQ
mmetsp:Transcript_5012/g.12908  ORF Transcript_5012/g.12908 Transcript_5012/m.12908 type:complete len:406 (-) Transcript_5012:921-2138(-)